MNIHVKVLQLHARIELYGKDLEFSHRATNLQLLRNICRILQLKSKTKMRLLHNCQIRLSEENKSCVIEFEILIIKYWRIKFLDTYHPLFPKQTSHLKK